MEAKALIVLLIIGLIILGNILGIVYCILDAITDRRKANVIADMFIIIILLIAIKVIIFSLFHY